jgi:hypothetical protein
MSINMYVSKDALEKLLGRFETAAYVGASGARADATQMLRRQFEGTFVIAAEDCRPSLDFTELCNRPCQKVQCTEP